MVKWIIAALLVVLSADAQRFPQSSAFSFGQGLCDDPNPATGPALYVDGTFLIAGDQAIASGREGRVLIYTNNAGAWVFSQTLIDNGTNSNTGWFGYCLAVASNWLAVGSTHSSASPGGMEGDVQMFQRSNNNTWAWTQYIRPTNSSTISDDEFGDALAFDGQTLLVSAPWHDYNTDTATGSIWFYTNSPANVWTRQQGPMIGLDTVSGDFFGGTLAIQGTNAFASAFRSGAGKIYRFILTNGMWGQYQTIVPLAPRSGGETFGSGGINVSGNILFTGAPMASSTVVPGGCYIFELVPTGTYTQVLSYVSRDCGPKTLFANNISLNGNIAVAGTRFADNLGQFNASQQATNSQGKIHVFRKLRTGWRLTDVLAPENRLNGDWLGSNVYTDGTNVYVISAGAKRAGTNCMIFNTFTNRAYNINRVTTTP